MTDEHKSNINSNNSNSSSSSSSNNNNNNNNNNSNERIIAEAAAKFLLKNGLNGSPFQLPPPSSSPSSSSSASAISLVTSNGFLPHANTTPTSKTTNSSSPSPRPSRSSAMAASAAVVAAAPVPKPNDMVGVLDYSDLNSVPTVAAAGSVKSGKGNSSFDMGRHPISTHTNNTSYGGRLQFFKDGKFILELARSKDSDKGGWVSVPRKAFRPPSAATSATVTPTSAVTTTYPKNENSTSLSFSDDNSSIQSSPWQRDQPWKQSRPRRGISKELSLYYHRPRQSVLNQRALQTAARKRRRPHEPITSSEEQLKIFDRIKTENGDDTLKGEVSETVEEAANEVKVEKPEAIKEEATAEHEAEANQSNESPAAEKETETALEPAATVEKMNTSEDEEAMSVAVDATVPSPPELNGNAHTEGATKPTTTTTDIRLKKHKPRAKLNSIIQKLIDGVPARLEQLSKTPAIIPSIATAAGTATERSGGGAIGGLSHSLTHKVSPPSAAATASRLVEYHHQHVSPRKRILREFEKVSLEDNGCVNNGSIGGGSLSSGAGGKRSRAKACAASSKTAPINLAPPQAKTPSTPTTTTAAQQQPTRLNSSYSIHSLLGGSSGSSSSSKAGGEHPAAIISNVHHPHALYANSASYSRTLLSSPKSPEMGAGSNGVGGGGKSPSHAASKKRSPPYTAAGSPLPIDYAHSFYAPYAAGGTGTSRPTTSSSSSTTVVSPHIPHRGSSSSRDLSPPRSSTASPATTPRTVPKKTASIRREFASPTASNSSCPSPGERSTSPPERRHMHLQRSSPAGGSPLHYYMYPPPQMNGSGGPTVSSTSQPVPATSSSSAAAAAAAAAAYIPSVVSPSLYHPYISTLAALRHNPLWMHHYQAGAAAPLLAPPHHQASGSGATSRLSPSSPYHPFTYNGVGAAAVAAAAAAAAFGQPNPSPHSHPHSHLAHLATPKLTDSSTDQMSAATSHRTASTSPASSTASVSSVVASGTSTSSAMFHNSNLRNEPSSDLPLNLSKH